MSGPDVDEARLRAAFRRLRNERKRDAGAAAPERVGSLVQSVLSAAGVERQVRRASITEDWGERVGDAIASVTRARSVSDETLFVEVASSAWLMELDMLKPEILARLNRGREDDRVGRIVFVLGEGLP